MYKFYPHAFGDCAASILAIDKFQVPDDQQKVSLGPIGSIYGI